MGKQPQLKFNNPLTATSGQLLNNVTSMAGITWIVMAYAIQFPVFGWVLGIIIGIASFYVGVTTYKIAIEARQLKQRLDPDGDLNREVEILTAEEDTIQKHRLEQSKSRLQSFKDCIYYYLHQLKVTLVIGVSTTLLTILLLPSIAPILCVLNFILFCICAGIEFYRYQNKVEQSTIGQYREDESDSPEIDAMMLPNQVRSVSLTKRIFDGICIFLKVSSVFVGSYIGYLVMGQKLGWPLSPSTFATLGIIFGCVAALGTAIYVAKLFIRYWTLLEGKLEEKSYFWEVMSIILTFFTTLDTAVLTVMAYNLDIPGGAGIVLGIAMGGISLFISMVMQIQVLIGDKSTSEDMDKSNIKRVRYEYVHTWKSNLFIVAAVIATLIMTVNTFIWTYTGYVALGTTVGWFAPPLFMAIGAAFGVLGAIATFQYFAAGCERFWISLLKVPVLELQVQASSSYANAPMQTLLSALREDNDKTIKVTHYVKESSAAEWARFCKGDNRGALSLKVVRNRDSADYKENEEVNEGVPAKFSC